MSLFDAFSPSQAPTAAPQRPQNQASPLDQLRANPGATLKQAGFSVPDGMSDPRQIINHLLRSGQVSNPRLMQMQQMMSRMMRR